MRFSGGPDSLLGKLDALPGRLRDLPARICDQWKNDGVPDRIVHFGFIPLLIATIPALIYAEIRSSGAIQRGMAAYVGEDSYDSLTDPSNPLSPFSPLNPSYPK
jgi:hypothetical protein